MIPLARELDLRIDAFMVWRASSSIPNLGPGFDKCEHPFVPSAALVPKTMIHLWERHGDRTSMQSHVAPLSLVCVDNAGS